MAAMPYPDKFHAAVRAAKVSAHNARFSDETKLLLYALDSQARNGACPVQSKWQMSAEDRAKYETWQNLGKMDAFEAMRLYVKLLDEEVPGWWRQPRREDEDALACLRLARRGEDRAERDERDFRTESREPIENAIEVFEEEDDREGADRENVFADPDPPGGKPKRRRVRRKASAEAARAALLRERNNGDDASGS